MVRLPRAPRGLAAVLLLFLAVSGAGLALGPGTDRDSIRVVATATGILHGVYHRSRSFGFPLHEFATAPAMALAGVTGANAATWLVTALGLAIASCLAGRRAALAAAALGFSPLILCDASAAIDFGWDFAAGMALLLAVSRPGAPPLIWCGVLACALMLLRPDNLLFVLAVLGTCALTGRLRWRQAALLLAIAGLIAAAVYLGLNGAGMLAIGVTTTRPLAARLARASVLLAAALGPGGAVALFALARTTPGITPGGTPAALLSRASFLAWALYLPRFALLPDQADYLILPVSLTTLTAIRVLPRRQAAFCALLIMAPSLVTLSLFARNPHTGALRLAPALQWGALPQEIAARRFANAAASPAVMRTVTAGLPRDTPPLQPATYMPGYFSAAGDLIVAQAALPPVLGPAATVPRRWFRALYGCADALGPGIGWRGLEAPLPRTLLARAAAGLPEPCALVDKAP